MYMQSPQFKLTDVLHTVADELRILLEAEGETELARQVAELSIVDRCRCGDDFCSTFYTQPKPKGSYPPGHRNVILEPERGMIIVDVVENMIMSVEILNRDEVRKELLALLP